MYRVEVDSAHTTFGIVICVCSHKHRSYPNMRVFEHRNYFPKA